MTPKPSPRKPRPFDRFISRPSERPRGDAPESGRPSRDAGRGERPERQDKADGQRSGRGSKGKGVPHSRGPVSARSHAKPEKNQDAKPEARPHSRSPFKARTPVAEALPTPASAPAEVTGPLTFSQTLRGLALKNPGDATARTGAAVAEPLADIPYLTELKLKDEAMRLFWKAQGLPDKPNLTLASPKPRGYRTTSKRRISVDRGEVNLDFKPEVRTPGAARLGSKSALEPEAHSRIYEFLLAKLRSEAYKILASALNFVVIRGDYERFAVILNVYRINAEVVRKAKLLAGQLEREKDLGIVSAWLFQGANDSPFYLDQSAPKGAWKAKRLYGPETFPISVGNIKYDFHPLGFSQINLSLLPTLVADTVAALKLRREDRLIDLYCGYGLFSLAAAPEASEVIGIDAAELAIPTARAMAAARKLSNVRYLRESIDPHSLMKLLAPPGDKPEVLLLDPPKSGVGAGVIRTLASRGPKRVVQLFCGMDALARDCDAWRRAGYMVAKAVPYDMFPGTDELEMLVVFVPDRFGLLNRVPVPVEKSMDPRSIQTKRQSSRPSTKRRRN